MRPRRLPRRAESWRTPISTSTITSTIRRCIVAAICLSLMYVALPTLGRLYLMAHAAPAGAALTQGASNTRPDFATNRVVSDMLAQVQPTTVYGYDSALSGKSPAIVEGALACRAMPLNSPS